MRHIAIFLLAAFLIPVGYQSVHVLQHHTDVVCSHHCDSKHHSDSTTHQQDVEQSSVLAESQHAYNNPKQERKHCPIVDFRFSVKELPQLAPLLSSQVATEVLTGRQLIAHYIETSYSQQNPRAPPRSHISKDDTLLVHSVDWTGTYNSLRKT